MVYDYSTLNAYCDVRDFRILTGIDERDELEDEDAQYYLHRASKMIIEDITIPRTDEELSIDGTTVSTSNKYIADIDCDGSISTSEVKVYGWSDRDNPSTKVELTVTNIYPREGKIVLSTVPNYDAITADYSYYLENIDLNKLVLPCAFLAAFLFAIKEYAFIPDTLTDGPVRFRYAVKPYMHFLHLYHQEIRRIYPYHTIRKKGKKMKLLRDKMI